jgi:hypothetical protein
MCFSQQTILAIEVKIWSIAIFIINSCRHYLTSFMGNELQISRRITHRFFLDGTYQTKKLPELRPVSTIENGSIGCWLRYNSMHR